MTLDALDQRRVVRAIEEGLKRGDRAARAAGEPRVGLIVDVPRSRFDGIEAELALAGFRIVREP